MFVVKNGVRFPIQIFKIFPEKILGFSNYLFFKNFPEKNFDIFKVSPFIIFVSFLDLLTNYH